MFCFLLAVIFSSHNVCFLNNFDLQTCWSRVLCKEKNTFWGGTHLALEWHWPLVGETGPWASSLPTSWSLGLAASRWILLNHFFHSSCFSQVFAMLRGGHRTWRTHKEKRSIRDPKTASPLAHVIGNLSSPTTWQIEQVHKSLKQIYSKIQKGITLLMDEKETCMDKRVWAPLWGHPTLELIKSVWSNKKPSRSMKLCRSKKKKKTGPCVSCLCHSLHRYKLLTNSGEAPCCGIWWKPTDEFSIGASQSVFGRLIQLCVCRVESDPRCFQSSLNKCGLIPLSPSFLHDLLHPKCLCDPSTYRNSPTSS